MATQQLNIRISPEEHSHLEQLADRTDGILTKQAVARLLIQHAIATGWDPLDKGVTLGKPSRPKAPEEGEGFTSSSSIIFNKKTNKERDIYPNLEKHTELIRDFWRVKKGSKSDQGWKLLMTELTKLQKTYGDTVVEEQLQLAINGLWKGVSMRLYEQFKAPSGNTPAQPEFKHPAYRDASEVLAEQDRIAQQNLEHLRRKQQEANTSGGVLDGLF